MAPLALKHKRALVGVLGSALGLALASLLFAALDTLSRDSWVLVSVSQGLVVAPAVGLAAVCDPGKGSLLKAYVVLAGVQMGLLLPGVSLLAFSVQWSRYITPLRLSDLCPILIATSHTAQLLLYIASLPLAAANWGTAAKATEVELRSEEASKEACYARLDAASLASRPASSPAEDA